MSDVLDVIVSDLCRKIIRAKNDLTKFEVCIENLSEALQERIVVLYSTHSLKGIRQAFDLLDIENGVSLLRESRRT
jgi:hypothetical protein